MGGVLERGGADMDEVVRVDAGATGAFLLAWMSNASTIQSAIMSIAYAASGRSESICAVFGQGVSGSESAQQ